MRYSRLTGRTRVAMCCALTTMALCVAGCGTGGTGSSSTAGPAANFKPGVLDKQYSGTTITVLVPSWAAMPQASVNAFTNLTGIKVQQQTLDFNAVHDKIVTSEAAGTAPADVTEMDWTWVSQFARANWYSDLAEFLPSGTISSDVGNSIFRYQGKQVAVPYNLDFRGTAVDMTVLDRAGITKVPTTWPQLLAAAQAVKSHGGPPYPVALPLSVTEGSATPFYALTKAAGGDVLDASQAPAFTGSDSAGRQAVTFVKTLYDDKLITPGAIDLSDQDVTNEFVSGQAPIVLSASPGLLSSVQGSATSTVKKDDVRFVAVPGASSPAKSLIGLQEGLGIPANAPHREAAAEFVYWWQQTQQQVTSYTDPNMGNVPAQQGALQTLVSQHELVGGEQVVALTKLVGPVFAGPAPTWYAEFSTDVAAMLQTVAEGRGSVDSALSTLAAQADALKSGGA